MAEAGTSPLELLVDGFARLLSATPDPVVARSRVLPRRPSSAGDLPLVSVGIECDRPRGGGLGRIADGPRAGVGPADPAVGDRIAIRLSGLASLEVWTASEGVSAEASRRIGERLAQRAAGRAHGFLGLWPASLAPAEHATRDALSGSAFPVWRQRLAYGFHFEAVPRVEEGGGIIERIDVDLNHAPRPGPEDRMVIPARLGTEGG